MLEITQFSDDAIWYAPDIDDNREKPEGQQFAVLIEPMTTREWRRLEETAGKLSKGKINFVKRHNALRERVIAERVLEVTNCFFVEIKSGEKKRAEITTGRELADKASETILEDILDAIKDQSELAEGLAKKSKAQSSSTDSQAMKSEGGGVQSATNRALAIAREMSQTETMS